MDFFYVYLTQCECWLKMLIFPLSVCFRNYTLDFSILSWENLSGQIDLHCKKLILWFILSVSLWFISETEDPSHMLIHELHFQLKLLDLTFHKYNTILTNFLKFFSGVLWSILRKNSSCLFFGNENLLHIIEAHSFSSWHLTNHWQLVLPNFSNVFQWK